MENRKLTIRPAVASDLAELKRGHLMTRFLARALHYQLGDRSWALTLEGRPIAAAGIWPGDGIAEAWFLATPALKGKSVLPIALPMIAAALQKLHRPSVPIIAAVAADNRGGRALASRLGFVDAGQHPDPSYPGCVMFVLSG